jgi:hypothetical protein
MNFAGSDFMIESIRNDHMQIKTSAISIKYFIGFLLWETLNKSGFCGLTDDC